MKWMKERDLLIAQTMEFVQSVRGRKSEPRPFAPPPPAAKPPAPVPIADLAAILADTVAAAQTPRPIHTAHTARPEPQLDFPSEIRARVASFRAHQERFSREREQYCASTLAKVRAVLGESADPSRPGK